MTEWLDFGEYVKDFTRFELITHTDVHQVIPHYRTSCTF